MPKPVKSRPKQKVKPKRKVEPEVPGITTKKSYWLMLLAVLVVFSVVFGGVLGFGLVKSALLAATVAVLIGTVGVIRVSKSSLSFGKRATFVFVGASVIGFSIWAAFALAFMPLLAAVGNEFFVFTSLAICLGAGALMGELLGRCRAVQERLFPQNL